MSASPHTPRGNGIFLDHLAHWIPDLAAGAADLERLGFRLTPYTEHTHSPAPGAAVVPAGTANHCIMLREGYLEILTAILDTPLASEVCARMARHVGVHLAAFCVNDAAAERERLIAQGFAQRPLVALEREAALADGTAVTLRFTVVRPEPGLLPEGRVQFLSQDTPELVWEERWLDQPNGAEALTDLLLCVDDADECALRYARYLRTDAQPLPGGRVLRFQRGALSILTPQTLRDAIPQVQPDPTPCIAGYALRVADLAATRAYLEGAGCACIAAGNGSLVVPTPPSLGGVVVFHAGDGPPWRG
jgi:hypothetical protein